jgi:hypothetical protein
MTVLFAQVCDQKPFKWFCTNFVLEEEKSYQISLQSMSSHIKGGLVRAVFVQYSPGVFMTCTKLDIRELQLQLLERAKGAMMNTVVFKMKRAPNSNNAQHLWPPMHLVVYTGLDFGVPNHTLIDMWNGGREDDVLRLVPNLPAKQVAELTLALGKGFVQNL